jgi:hypothetical protein
LSLLLPFLRSFRSEAEESAVRLDQQNTSLQSFTKFLSKNPSKIPCQAPKPRNSLSANDMRVARSPCSIPYNLNKRKEKALNPRIEGFSL